MIESQTIIIIILIILLIASGVFGYLLYSSRKKLLLEYEHVYNNYMQLKEVNETQKDEFDRYYLAIRGSDVGVWDWNLKTDEIYFSPRWKEMIGFNEKELPNTISAWKVRIHDEDKAWAEKNIMDHIDGHTIKYQNTYRIKHKNGKYIWIIDQGFAFKDAEGKAYRMVGTHTDITQQKEIEEELIMYREHLESLVKKRTSDLKKAKEKAEQSEKLKSSFLSNMSHEIRTPMNAIIGFSNLLLHPDISESQKFDYISNIKDAGVNLLQLIDDIIELSKIETEELEFNKTGFLINEILSEVKTIFELEKIKKRKYNIELKIKSASEENNFYIFTDYMKLRQIFCYLTENAVKFTQEGSVEVGFYLPQTDDTLHKGEIIDAPKLTFYVKDTGIGIDEKNQTLIFERFRKVEDKNSVLYAGTGLGLTISRKLVNLLGGEIWVESEHNKGSIFYFSIEYKM